MSDQLKARWIWYPGDFEMMLHLRISLRRETRGSVFPAFWPLDGTYNSVLFRKKLNLSKPEKVSVVADGRFSVALDDYRGNLMRDCAGPFELPQGEHELYVMVANTQGLPAVIAQGETFVSDGSWEVCCYESDWVRAGLWNLEDLSVPPSRFRLPTTEIHPVDVRQAGQSFWVDFGKEVFAGLKLSGMAGAGKIDVFYGESREEAEDEANCELLDRFAVDRGNGEHIFPLRAFRYVNIRMEQGISIGEISAMFEYLPLEERGGFRCSNERLNQIWDVSAYTLRLNTREFFLDGIKRDGWVWSGDAYQSFLMNYYSFFDVDVNRRTLTALRGKDPVRAHVNTILDYTLIWFMSLYDHYFHTGDMEFLRQIYKKALSLMDFCLSRRNGNGMLEGRPEDWVFIDWADFEKRGEVCAEQLLFCRSLEVMAKISGLMGDKGQEEEYQRLAGELRRKTMDAFWDEELGGFVSARLEGKLCREITKHPSIFALLFGYLDERRQECVRERVILNEAVPKITTPYFQFFELSALCEMEEHSHVLEEILSYWGGMLDLGTTTFWEVYDPTMQGSEHYAMYGRSFEKSLCHAWGASPIYLLGRYFLGVRALEPAYQAYEIKPRLGSLAWMEGKAPTPDGAVEVFMDLSRIRVKGAGGTGYLRFRSAAAPKVHNGEARSVGNGWYETVVRPYEETTAEYTL